MLDDLVSGYAFQILLCYTEEFIDDTVTLMCLGILWVQNKPKLLPFTTVFDSWYEVSMETLCKVVPFLASVSEAIYFS